MLLRDVLPRGIPWLSGDQLSISSRSSAFFETDHCRLLEGGRFNYNRKHGHNVFSKNNTKEKLKEVFRGLSIPTAVYKPPFSENTRERRTSAKNDESRTSSSPSEKKYSRTSSSESSSKNPPSRFSSPPRKSPSTSVSTIDLPWVPRSSSPSPPSPGISRRRETNPRREAISLPGGEPLPPWLLSPSETKNSNETSTSFQKPTTDKKKSNFTDSPTTSKNRFSPSQTTSRVPETPSKDVMDSLPKVFPPSSRKKKPPPPPLPQPEGNSEIAPMDLPFEFKFSYTEEPDVAPIGYREPVFSPFGPNTMSRPWTGGPPLKKSKKNKLPRLIPEFDSFTPPGPKKGVKPVEAPGPFPEDSGPRYVRTREEILGPPLTKEEKEALILDCIQGRRQVNLGRDGLIHNMLDLIHSHWKRRRVAKIKCKGVPTVDMDKVCREIEDKTGGKILDRAGGVVYVFRGRNYNYKTRPRIPLMLWKPPAPIYPRLIQDAPEGLTREEANELRIRGRKLHPVTRLNKNGVYINLVNQVRKGFEINDLVSVDCTGLEKSDYKKIGAKLKSLVPCVLLSFEKEQILMWRGQPGGISRSNDSGGEEGEGEREGEEEREGEGGRGETNKEKENDKEDDGRKLEVRTVIKQQQNIRGEREGGEGEGGQGEGGEEECDEFDRLWEQAKLSGAMSELNLSYSEDEKDSQKGGNEKGEKEKKERWPGNENNGETLTETILNSMENSSPSNRNKGE